MNQKPSLQDFPKNYRSLASYFHDIKYSEPLSPEEEVEIAKKAKEGNLEAKTKLVEANLRFVVSIAKKYEDIATHLGVTFGDLISAGNLGLVKAVEHYDETRGFKFITCAVWWIKQSIQYHLTHDARTVRLPANVIQDFSAIDQASNTLTQEIEANPTSRELSDYLEMPIPKIDRALDAIQFPLHLDREIQDQEGETSTFYEIIADENAPPPDTTSVSNGLKKEIASALEILDERERYIIKRYFGLSKEKPQNLREIAKRFGVSRERVRQIKEKALEKLGDPNTAIKLSPYYEEI